MSSNCFVCHADDARFRMRNLLGAPSDQRDEVRLCGRECQAKLWSVLSAERQEFVELESQPVHVRHTVDDGRVEVELFTRDRRAVRHEPTHARRFIATETNESSGSITEITPLQPRKGTPRSSIVDNKQEKTSVQTAGTSKYAVYSLLGAHNGTQVEQFVDGTRLGDIVRFEQLEGEGPANSLQEIFQKRTILDCQGTLPAIRPGSPTELLSKESIRQTFLILDQQMARATETTSGKKKLPLIRDNSAASTVFAFVKDRCIVLAWLGNAQALFVTPLKKKPNRFFTPAHTTADEKERQRVQAAGGKIDADGRLIVDDKTTLPVTRAFGGFALKQTKSNRGELRYNEAAALIVKPGVFDDNKVMRLSKTFDSFLVMGDEGLWSAITKDEVLQIIDNNGGKKNSVQAIDEEIVRVLTKNVNEDPKRKTKQIDASVFVLRFRVLDDGGSSNSSGTTASK